MLYFSDENAIALKAIKQKCIDKFYNCMEQYKLIFNAENSAKIMELYPLLTG